MGKIMDIVLKKDGKELEKGGKAEYIDKLQKRILSYVENKTDLYDTIDFHDDLERLRFANSILHESSPMAVLTVLLLMASTERERIKLDAARVIGNWVGLEKLANMGVVVNLSDISGGELKSEIVEMQNELTDRTINKT